MFRTSWVDPNTGEEFQYNWGFGNIGIPKKFRKDDNMTKISYLCGRCRYYRSDFGGCADCDKGSHFIEKPKGENDMDKTNYAKYEIRKKMNGIANRLNMQLYTPYKKNESFLDFLFFNQATGYSKFVRLYPDKANIEKSTFKEIEKFVYENSFDPSLRLPSIKNVIFNDPATIVFWSDNTKTVVKCRENDVFDPEKGLAMAISKKVLCNNKGRYYEEFKKWLPKDEDTCQ